MKRLFSIISVVLALTAISCERIDENLQDGPVVITASLEQLSRVSYAEDASHNLEQTWEVGDVLVGVDDSSNEITMRVASVDGNGVATLEITKGALPLSGSIHMMYGVPSYYGDPSWPYSLDLYSQKVATSTTVPAILTADAEVSGSSINLTFANQTAILGIKGFHGLPAGAEIDRFIISGVTPSANVNISAGATVITPSAMGLSSVSLTKATTWTANASGEVDDVFYVAVFPNASATQIRIQAQLNDGSVYCNELGSKTVAAAKYYYMNNKALTQVVASIGSTPYYSIEDAFAAANASGGYLTLWLSADCTTTRDFNVPAGRISLELNGHTLDMNGRSINVETAEASLFISDSEGTGKLIQSGSSSLLYVTNGAVDISDAEFECTGTGRVLRMSGGEVDIHDGTSFTSTQPSTYVMLVEGGTLNIDGGEFEHTSATGYHIIYTQNGAPTVNITGGVFRGAHTTYNLFAFTSATEVNIGGDAVFINTGSKSTFAFYLPGNSNNVHITGGYYTNNNAFYSDNSNVVTLSGGYFRSSSLTTTRCTYKASHSNRNVYPSVSKEGYTFGYRISHNSIHRWGFSIASGEMVFPAQYNCKYTPSTTTWAFQSSYENYTTGYNADEVNLFTWGDPAEYTNPASTSGRSGLFGGQSLAAEDDWGASMPSCGLFTLTQAQWDYLLNTRSTSTVNGVPNARYMKCTIQDSKGLLIFPDDFSWPAGAGAETTATAINDPNADFTTVVYYRSPASYLTAAGCIFLRADGYRDGTSDSECGTAGYYWTSTSYSSSEPWFLYFDNATLSIRHDSGMTVGKGAAVRVFSK